MNDFWASRTGQELTGLPEDAYQPQFKIIPDGTMALASIKSFELISKEIDGQDTQYYQITWKITSDDYKGREVTQKIKAFDSKPEIAQRALNMLKLIYSLCGHIPKHSGVPTDDDHRFMLSKILGIKIGEWSMPKQEGGFREGNNVTEVHKVQEFKTTIGIKREPPKVKTAYIESAFSRNPRVATDPNDVPW
jgi:hypothetical protein